MKNSKKGFTLVELLVVIAILAILATVAVVGYTSFIDKANLSNDQAFVAQANTTLQAAAIPNGFKTAGEAITALNRNGFQGKFNTYSSGFHYAYSLEKNKLYLVDDENKVVYPDTDVELSSLWGLYMDNRTSAVVGITKYVALTNITNTAHYNDVFANGSYTIDLNGCLLSVEATDGVKANVTANNGIVISGATAGEGVDRGYTVVDTQGVESFDITTVQSDKSTAEEIVIENKIFTQRLWLNTFQNVKFVNCIFYDDATLNLCDIDDKGEKLTYENCQFININGHAIIAYRSVSLNNCTFTGVSKYALQIQENTNTDNQKEMSVEVKGCTFDGTSLEYPIIRFVAGHSKVTSVEISDCNFITLNKAYAIIGYSEDVNGTAIMETPADKWTFSGNTFGNMGDKPYVIGNTTLNEAFKNSAK